MAPVNQESQLELFDVSNQPTSKPRRDPIGHLLLHLRYDHCILGSIASLLGLTVVFACGVERGKQLVRSERVMVARAQPTGPPEPSSTSAAESPVAGDESRTTTSPPRGEPKSGPTPIVAPKKKEPSRLASRAPRMLPGAAGLGRPHIGSTQPAGTSRYAIQVVTYRQRQLAKNELERLHARGERAFLIIREGRTSVYVGPFPSRDNASEKLVSLKTRYLDCFLKTL